MKTESPKASSDWFWRWLSAVLAFICLWRVWLYLESAYFGPAIPVHEAAFTFMPLPDFIFSLFFLWLARRADWRQNALHRETGIIVAALHLTALLAYGVFFHQWTKGAAFSFERSTTYLYAVLPALFAAALLIYLVRISWQNRASLKQDQGSHP